MCISDASGQAGQGDALRKISKPEAANAFAAEFMTDYNWRFAKEPRHDFNVYRALDADDNLDLIFTWHEPRRVSKSLTVQYDKTLYLLEGSDKSRQVMGKYIEIYHYPDGNIELRANGTALPCSAYDRLPEVDQGAIVENKRLAQKSLKSVTGRVYKTLTHSLASVTVT